MFKDDYKTRARLEELKEKFKDYPKKYDGSVIDDTELSEEFLEYELLLYVLDKEGYEEYQRKRKQRLDLND